MTRIRLPIDRSETGASLILALAMVTLISVALVAALGFATASLHTVSLVGSQRATAYAADSAMETAVQTMRTNTACPAVTSTAVGGQPAAAVGCSVVQAASTVAPPYALWSVGNNVSETGINFAGTSALQMNAPVASNSTITVPAGSLSSVYDVRARSTCTGTITVNSPGVKSCNAGTPYADPGYASETLPAFTTPNPPPTCTANDAILQFSAGYYSDVTDFSGAGIYTQGGKTCKTGFLYFQPGVYYFDFGFDNANGNVWNVTQNVIGGQAKGFDPTVPGSVPNQPNPGGATSVNCKTAADGATDGVQFIFGGPSQMVANTNGAIVELCPKPTPANSPQQMTIFGQNTGAATPLTPKVVGTAVGTLTPTTGWTTSANARLIDGAIASHSVPAATPASVVLTGFPASPIPVGAGSQKYTLDIAHFETTSTNLSSLSVTIASAGGTCVLAATAKSALTTEALILPTTPACTASVQSVFTVTIKSTAKASTTITEKIDGVDLVNTYTPAGAHAESGCTIVINSCSVLTVGGTQAKFVSWGTVYAPLGRVTVNVTDSADVVSFRRGVIARAISIPALLAPNTTDYFCLASGSPCTGSTGAAGPRIELLTATVNGNVELRALVSFVDTPAPGTSLQILSWNPTR